MGVAKNFRARLFASAPPLVEVLDPPLLCVCVCVCVCAHDCVYIYYVHSSYMTLIGMHEMHGRVNPNQRHITDLLVIDSHSSLAYLMMTHPLPIAGKLPI